MLAWPGESCCQWNGEFYFYGINNFIHIVEYLKKKLGIEVGQTTTDGKFTLSEVECLGSCGTAPMMQLNDEYLENLTEQKIDKILSELD